MLQVKLPSQGDNRIKNEGVSHWFHDTSLKCRQLGSWRNRRPWYEETVDALRLADPKAWAKLFTIKAPCHICLTFRTGVTCCSGAECQLKRRVNAERDMKSNRRQQMQHFHWAPSRHNEMSWLLLSRRTKCYFIESSGDDIARELINLEEVSLSSTHLNSKEKKNSFGVNLFA